VVTTTSEQRQGGPDGDEHHRGSVVAAPEVEVHQRVHRCREVTVCEADIEEIQRAEPLVDVVGEDGPRKGDVLPEQPVDRVRHQPDDEHQQGDDDVGGEGPIAVPVPARVLGGKHQKEESEGNAHGQFERDQEPLDDRGHGQLRDGAERPSRYQHQQPDERADPAIREL
jgi:hypothetical protein